MFTLISVERVAAAPRSEPGVAHYDVLAALGRERQMFWAEVRTGSGPDQVDWADELQDLLREHHVLATDYGRLSGLIYGVHCGSSVELPAVFGAA